MGIIFLIAVLLIILARYILFSDCSEYSQKKFLIFSGIIIILLFSIRDAEIDIGSDLNNYYRLYCRAIESTSLSVFLNTNPFEKGYLILNWLLSRVIKWPQFILFFQSAFCIGVTFRYIYKYSQDLLISVLGFMSLGLMQFYLTGFRQSIAIAICLIALELAEKRKMIKFILLVALATSIHQTSIIFAIVYILMKIPITKFTVIIEFVAVLVLAQVIPDLIALGNDVFEKEYTGVFTGNSTGGLINLFISATVLGLMYLRFFLNVRKNGNIKNRISSGKEYMINNYYINYKLMPLLILGTGFYAMRYQALVLERISLYFTPTLFILLPQVINTMFEEKSRKLLRIILLIGMIFLGYWRLRTFPYITIL